jgi:polysaccharide export outer membrane protein
MVVLALMLAAATKAQERGKVRGDERRSLVAREESRQGQKSEPAWEDSTYLIGPEDVLDISVWKEPDFTRAVPVRPDGKISLPLLNDVQASGLTPIQLARTLTVMLRKYVTQPQVTVIITQINSRRVYVLGEVNRPGALSLLPHMTVLEALASAGGFTPFAKEKKIYVLRNQSGKQNRYPFNYKEAMRGGALQRDFPLVPGDTIMVP